MNVFIDTSLGAKRLREALLPLMGSGEVVHIHTDLFKPSENDVDWMSALDQRGGFTVFLRDKRISRRAAEIQVLSKTSLPVFTYVGTDPSAAVVATAFCNALPAIRSMVAREQRPFIANVYADGALKRHCSVGEMKEVIRRNALAGR